MNESRVKIKPLTDDEFKRLQAGESIAIRPVYDQPKTKLQIRVRAGGILSPDMVRDWPAWKQVRSDAGVRHTARLTDLQQLLRAAVNLGVILEVIYE